MEGADTAIERETLWYTMNSHFTVILKLFYLAINSACAHISLRSPNAPPPEDEQARYSKQSASTFGERGFTVLHAGLVSMALVHFINTSELVAILLTLWPTTAPYRLELPQSASASAGVLRISPAFAIGTLFMLLGTTLRAVCYRLLGHCFTGELAIRKGHRLVTCGPYAVVRHPSYTGVLVFAAGVVTAHLGPGSLGASAPLSLWARPLGAALAVSQLAALAYIAFVVAVLRVRKEDAMLMEEFGEEWVVWARSTPDRLVPGFY